MIQKTNTINFPQFSGIRCLMMPYIQVDPDSIPREYSKGYEEILINNYIEKGKIGFLTIDESFVKGGNAHRGMRAKYDRALHTEAGIHPDKVCAWGGTGWGSSHRVTLNRDVQILLANSIDESCAVWDNTEIDTTLDGDIGHLSEKYPYSDAVLMRAGDVYKIGILTPHESLPVKQDTNRQFLRIVSSGVYGREPYFTENPLFKFSN